MSIEYHESHPPPNAAPIDVRTVEFDWAAVFIELGEPDDEPEQFDALAFVLQRLLSWFADVDLARPGAEVFIARRVIALAWTVNPSLFTDSPSLASLARRLRINRVSLSEHAAAARRTFAIQNRAQAHIWNYQTADEQDDAHKTPAHSGTFAPFGLQWAECRAAGARNRVRDAFVSQTTADASHDPKRPTHVNGHTTPLMANGAPKHAGFNGRCLERSTT